MTDVPTAKHFSWALQRLSLPVFLAAASLAVLFLAWQPAIKAAHASAGPSIEMSPTTYDFGQAKEGTAIEHDFVIRNTGTEVLNIADVKTG